MSNDTLEKLYKERTLLKQLLSTDRERYSYLEGRIQEIKILINTEYAPIAYSNVLFATYNFDIAKKITEKGTELLRDFSAQQF